MSYTGLVAYSAGPLLLVLIGFAAGGEFGAPIAVVGGLIEAFVLAKFFDRRSANQ
jgi:hypothetical protein